MENVVTQMTDGGLLTPATAERVHALLSEGQSLEDAVLAADGVSEEALLRFLAASFDIPYVDLEKNPPAKEILAAFPARLLVRHRILPIPLELPPFRLKPAAVDDGRLLLVLKLVSLAAHQSHPFGERSLELFPNASQFIQALAK